MGRGGGHFFCYSFGGEVYPDARAYLGSEGRRSPCHRYRRNAQDHRRHRNRRWDTGCWHKRCLQCTTAVKDGAAITPATAPVTACDKHCISDSSRPLQHSGRWYCACIWGDSCHHKWIILWWSVIVLLQDIPYFNCDGSCDLVAVWEEVHNRHT